LDSVRIKICGITRVEDAIAAAELGADAIGLNFYPKSRRYVSPEASRDILRNLPPFVDPVALFVNEPLSEVIARVRELLAVRTVQIHADAPEPIPRVPCQFIVAFAVRDPGSLAEIEGYLSKCRDCGQMPAAILVDAHVPGEYGGTGQVAPWRLLADFRPEVPLILAGGLTPENVAEAVRIVRPYSVDVASGVESGPGQKDREKMRRFIAAVRQACS
jgi:phosphoribosylanthranilate isomerase